MGKQLGNDVYTKCSIFPPILLIRFFQPNAENYSSLNKLELIPPQEASLNDYLSSNWTRANILGLRINTWAEPTFFSRLVTFFAFCLDAPALVDGEQQHARQGEITACSVVDSESGDGPCCWGQAQTV